MSDAKRTRALHLAKRIAIDVRPLRESRDYRLLWIGNGISSLGSSVALIAVPYQVYQLTRSPFMVGMLGAAALLPLLFGSIFGGALADSSDRRTLMRWLLLAQGLSSAVLAWQAMGAAHLWVLFVMSALQAGLWGLVIPTRRSWAPRLVRPDQLAASAALESAAMTFTHLAGPALGGVTIAVLGLAWTYSIDVISFGVAIAAVTMMRPSPASEHAPAAGLRSVLEGLRFLKGRKVLQAGFLIDLNAMVFGMPKALFPAMAVTLGGGSKLFGLLATAPFLGAFLGTITSGWTSHVKRQGLGVSLSVVGWGLSIAAFGVAPNAAVALVALACAGYADDISAILRTAIVQEVTPDHLRGRLSGMEIAVYAGGPTLGDVESGIVAGLTTVRTSVISGGLACLVGAVAVAALMPGFNRYDRTKGRGDSPPTSEPDENASDIR